MVWPAGLTFLALDIMYRVTHSIQQVQSYNSAAIAWGALGKPLYATGTRYGVGTSELFELILPY